VGKGLWLLGTVLVVGGLALMIASAFIAHQARAEAASE
jgi:hypothetical protein